MGNWGEITPISGVMTLLKSSRGPPFLDSERKNGYLIELLSPKNAYFPPEQKNMWTRNHTKELEQ